jgi:hypothetical protein
LHRGKQLTNEPIDLDDYLASRSFDVPKEKLNTYEAILAAVLRKYVPEGRKIEIDMVKVYKDTILDVTLDDNGKAKISWGEA